MYSGLRIGELCALTWNDIDFENGASFMFLKRFSAFRIKRERAKR
ncbi:MAG: hypothetical protein KH377_09140 [[Eubacterium] siraeum]|nr:hypothetical protein [[Eubacterium] siraeum]